MLVKNNFNLYTKLREKFKFFSYESYNIFIEKDNIRFSFCFNLSDRYIFNPSYNIPFNEYINYDKLNEENFIENVVFNIGMAELVSYWKSACPQYVYIIPKHLTNEQIEWWKNLYFNGLGEFFWLNNIKTNKNDFMTIETSGDKVLLKNLNLHYSQKTIVPVGGGKDSVVSMELLKNHKNILPFAINPTTPVFNTIEAAGFNKDNFFITYRYLDPLLFDLNKKGFLNGHTPFSSIVAFNSLLAAHLTNSKYIALSNEASSNEPTVPDSTVNHQYSKSILFENDFRNYVSNYINDELNYFSFLRPLSELQIAKLFSKFEHQYNAFKSCNVGGKNNIWCCSCAKCLFTYIILSPFITQTKMKEIFGKNIFDDDKLKNELDKLSGVENIKPFECVGTVEEVNIALQSLDDNEVINKPLLQHYRNSISANTNYIKLSDYDFQKINENNFLPDDFKTILINALKSI